MMGEKWLYFFNILVSRWVNALGPSGLRAPVKSILVVKWDEIGDMAASVHVFGLLKQAHPEAEIHVLCKPFVSTLIESDPAITHIFTDPSEWKSRYDVVIELRGTWYTLWKSLSLGTMPKFRVDRGWIRFLQRGAQPHEVVTNARIIEPLLGSSRDSRGEATSKEVSQWLAYRKLYTTHEHLAEAKNWMSTVMDFANIETAHPQGYAILHTGARSALRRWSLERYVSLSQWLLKDKNLMPVWVGTADEEGQLDEAFALGAVGRKWVAPKGSSLLSFYAFIASSKLYVGNESGPLQLADIAGVPLVAVYGPGVPFVFYPLSRRSRVLHEILDCNPCNQQQCVRPADRCVDRISLYSVKMAIDEVMQIEGVG